MNRGKDQSKMDLYNQIINLSYSNYPEEFENSMLTIMKSKLITKELKKYLNDKAKEKEVWVKGYLKAYFCCGLCTTSRIESKHSVLKQYLNSGRRLSELFQVMKQLEDKEVNKLKNEIESKHKKERTKIGNSDLIIYFKGKYTEYALERLKDNSIESINYKVMEMDQNQWYYFIFES